MGYGYVVGGVEDWVVTGNVDLSTHLVPPRMQDCFGEDVDPPGGFQLSMVAAADGAFQEEFEKAVLGFTWSWWPSDTVMSENCLGELIGAGVLDDIRAGKMGQLWEALEAAENGEHIGRCVSLYEPPEIDAALGQVMVGVSACEPLCAVVELTNLSETLPAAMEAAEFLLEGFLVDCDGLPASIEPGAAARCTIYDYITPGFQALKWNGFAFAGEQNGWGIVYPFED